MKIKSIKSVLLAVILLSAVYAAFSVLPSIGSNLFAQDEPGQTDRTNGPENNSDIEGPYNPSHDAEIQPLPDEGDGIPEGYPPSPDEEDYPEEQTQ